MTGGGEADIPRALDHALEAEPDGEALRAIWRELPVPPELPTPDAARRAVAWQRLSARLEAKSGSADVVPIDAARTRASAGVASAVSSDTRSARRHGMRRAAWRIAAAVALMLSGAAIRQGMPETLTVPAGAAPRTYRLADASRLTLAPGSTARLRRGFRSPLGLPAGERAVRLHGEAFFEVARDGRPFLVNAGDATVRVLGTRFEVRTAIDGASTRVAVEEGRVTVERAGGGAVTLGRGQGTELRAGAPLEIATVRTDRLGAWRTGGFAAIDEPLAAVAAALERRYGTEIRLEARTPAADLLTVYYPVAPAVETILTDLCTARGLVLRRTSRGYVIAPASQP